MYKVLSISKEYPEFEHAVFNSDVSFTDYDIVVIDPRSVEESFPKAEVAEDNKHYIRGRNAHELKEIMQRRQSEILALLNNGKMVISFLTPIYKVRLRSDSIKSGTTLHNYSWLPEESSSFVNNLIEGKGSGITLVAKEHPFSAYFHAFKNALTFTAYVNISVQAFDKGEAILSNLASRVVSFSQKISNGAIVFLPDYLFNPENDKKFVGVILDIVTKILGTHAKSVRPEWVRNFTVPGLEELNAKITGIQEQISTFESQKSNIEAQRDNLDDYKFLLYEQGHALQNKVVEALRLMGFNAETIQGENTDYDVVLDSEEGRAIAEVEGKDDDAIHKGKIDQLLSAINQDAGKSGSFAKGVMIGNHYRLITLAERKEPFTQTVSNLAKQYRYALMTTSELYNAAIYLLAHPDDEKYKKACREAIFKAEGVLVTFPPPDRL